MNDSATAAGQTSEQPPGLEVEHCSVTVYMQKIEDCYIAVEALHVPPDGGDVNLKLLEL